MMRSVAPEDLIRYGMIPEFIGRLPVVSVLDELTALKPAHVVPSHGKLGDAALIARDKTFIQAVQTRVGALKKEGKSADDAVAAVIAEIAPQYPEFGNATNAGAMARAAYAEAK